MVVREAVPTAMIVLNDILNITRDVVRVNNDEGSWSDIFGMIAKKRDYTVKDPQGKYSPFLPKGYLNRNPWRAMPIREIDENGRTVFDGQIYDVKSVDDGRRRAVIISCRDPLGVKLDWPVNMCDLTTYAGWKVSAYTAAGGNTVSLAAVSGTPSDIIVNSIVSFNEDYSPSYRVTAVDTGTDTITLDRNLVEEITGNTVVNVAVPTIETPAGAIRRAFESAGIGNRIDSSFSILDLSDSANYRKLWFFIRPENKVKLRDFIALVMEKGDLYISVPANGIISCRRGLRTDGERNLPKVTGAELIGPMTGPYYDTTRLIYAYDVIFTVPSVLLPTGAAHTGEVRKISNQVSSDALSEYAATDVWRPVSLQSSDIREYTILYASESCARYFAERRLAYYGVPRVRISAAVKRAVSGKPEKRYTFSLFDDVKLVYPVTTGIQSSEQNAVIVDYKYNFDQRKYDKVEFELTGGAEISTTEFIEGEEDMKTGFTAPFAGSTPPDGYLACDGSAVSRTTYAALFTAIGITHGSGNGSTTFNLPDMRGLFIRGAGSHGTMTKAAGGAFAGGGVGDTGNDSFQGWKVSKLTKDGLGGPPDSFAYGGNTTGPTIEMSPVSDGVNGTPRVGSETKPAYISMLWCIKY